MFGFDHFANVIVMLFDLFLLSVGAVVLNGECSFDKQCATAGVICH